MHPQELLPQGPMCRMDFFVVGLSVRRLRSTAGPRPLRGGLLGDPLSCAPGPLCPGCCRRLAFGSLAKYRLRFHSQPCVTWVRPSISGDAGVLTVRAQIFTDTGTAPQQAPSVRTHAEHIRPSEPHTRPLCAHAFSQGPLSPWHRALKTQVSMKTSPLSVAGFLGACSTSWLVW